jgi:hypothetical protein
VCRCEARNVKVWQWVKGAAALLVLVLSCVALREVYNHVYCSATGDAFNDSTTGRDACYAACFDSQSQAHDCLRFADSGRAVFYSTALFGFIGVAATLAGIWAVASDRQSVATAVWLLDAVVWIAFFIAFWMTLAFVFFAHMATALITAPLCVALLGSLVLLVASAHTMRLRAGQLHRALADGLAYDDL